MNDVKFTIYRLHFFTREVAFHTKDFRLMQIFVNFCFILTVSKIGLLFHRFLVKIEEREEKPKVENILEEKPTTGETTNESRPQGKENEEEAREPPAKKPKTKGQNKARPRTVPKIAADMRICPTIHRGDVCRFGDKCKFKHDVHDYMENKAPDIGKECINLKLFGKCKFGVECRFGMHHISPDTFENLVDEELYKETMKNFSEKDQNVLTKDLMNCLRKKKYKYEKTGRYLKSAKLSDTRPSRLGEESQNPVANTDCIVNNKNDDVDIAADIETSGDAVVTSSSGSNGVTTDTTTNKSIGVVTDEDLVKLRSCEKNKVAILFCFCVILCLLFLYETRS